MSWLFTSVPLKHQWMLALVLPFTRFLLVFFAYLITLFTIPGITVDCICIFLAFSRELGAVILTHLGGQVNIIMQIHPDV